MTGQFSSINQREFETTLRDGINAVKDGQRRLAQMLLNRAIMMNSADARPYLWLSATTEDPKEQREYLEQAVARDPTNAAARRGLAVLMGKIDKSRLMPEGSTLKPAHPGEEVMAQAQSFLCPQCGGHMSFSVEIALLKCEYCGFVKVDEQLASPSRAAAADRAEQVLDFVMPTTRGHSWAVSLARLSCERCGALSLLPAGQKATQCPYCGSNQLIESAELGELVDPQVIALMNIDEQQAMQNVRKWLKSGAFAPDDLLVACQGICLRPAYYSFWTFDGTVEVRWSCEIKEGSGRYQHWESINGVEAEFFNDILVPGVRAMTWKEMESIEPFDLVNVEEFKSEHLAGWPAIIYNRSLSDASLLAREKEFKRLRPQVYNNIAVGREKRNVQIGTSAWSGMTFKHVLLPVWIGTYRYQRQEYHLLVNGQTGKVGGFKPRDTVKMLFAGLIAAILVMMVLFLFWYFSQ